MRKKLYSLMLLVALVLTQVVCVSAADVTSEADLENLPQPPGSVIYSFGLETDITGARQFNPDSSGRVGLSNAAGNYKVLTYVPSTGEFWYDWTDAIEIQPIDPSQGSITTEVSAWDFSYSMSEALAKVKTTYVGDFFDTFVGHGAYVIFFQENAKTLYDAVFACKSDNLLWYVFDPASQGVDYDGHFLVNDLEIHLLEKVSAGNGVIGGKYSVKYNIDGYVEGGKLYPDFAQVIDVDGLEVSIQCPINSTHGEEEFVLSGISNGEYMAYITTMSGRVYSRAFNVDYITGSAEAPSQSEQESAFTGPYTAPVVSFDGIPSGANSVSGSLTFRVKTDIPAQLVFDGIDYPGYVTENEVTVGSNGSYYYTVISEAGKQTSGFVSITCFADGLGEVGESLFTESLSLATAGTNLVQTGEEKDTSGSNPVVIALAVIAVVSLAGGCLVLFRKKNGKSILSGLLALIVVFGIGTSSASAAWIYGSTWVGAVVGSLYESGVPLYRDPDTGVVPNKVGILSQYAGDLRGTMAVRLLALPVDDYATDGYFTFNGNRIQLQNYTNLVSARYYNDPSNWIYFSNGLAYQGNNWEYAQHEYDELIQVLDNGVAHSAQMWKTNSGKYNTLLEIAGVSDSGTALTEQSFLTRVLTSQRLDKERLGREFFGLTEEQAKNFYVVAEPVYYDYQYFVNTEDGITFKQTPVTVNFGDGSKTYTEWKIGETYSTAMARDTRSSYSSAYYYYWVSQFIYGRVPTTGYNGIRFLNSSNCSVLGTRMSSATWSYQTQVLGYYVSPASTTARYCLYGFGNLGGSRGGANLTLEYKGEANTSDDTQFVATGSIVGIDTSSDYNYYDFSTGKWRSSSNSTEMLQLSPLDMSDSYAVVYASADTYNIGYSDVVIGPSNRSAFSTDLLTGGFNLTWGSRVPTDGTRKIGYLYTITGMDGGYNTVRSRFSASLSSGYGYFSSYGSTDVTSSCFGKNVSEACWNVAETAFTRTSDGAIWQNITPTGDTAVLRAGNTLGVGFEFVAKGSDVTSRRITLKIELGAESKVSSVSASETWTDNYTTVTQALCDIESEALGYVVVTGAEDSLTDDAIAALQGTTLLQASNAVNKVRAALTSADLCVSWTSGGDTVGLGSYDADDTDDEPPVGFTVYELVVVEDGEIVPFEPIPTVGKVDLPAFMLNRYFNDIIATSSSNAGSMVRYTVNPNEWTWTAWDAYKSCSWSSLYNVPTAYKQDYNIEYKDFSASTEFGFDTGDLAGMYYPKADSTSPAVTKWGKIQHNLGNLTGNWGTVQINTAGLDVSTYYIDYGFNLIRSAQGDNRAMSGISYATYEESTSSSTSTVKDEKNMLRLKDYFGVVPQDPILDAESVRNSVAVVSKWDEHIDMQSRFVWYGSAGHGDAHNGDGIRVHSISHLHDNYHGDWYAWCDITRYYLETECLYDWKAQGFRLLMSGGSSPTRVLNYVFTNTVYKYQTTSKLQSDLEIGWNSAIYGDDGLTTVNDNHVPVSTPLASSAPGGSITSRTAYRFAHVRTNDARFHYFPEAYMVFKIGTDDMAYTNGLDYVKGYVIGEDERELDSSTLYFFKVNTTVAGAQVDFFPGTVYSDSMQGGTGIYGAAENLVSIPAGSNVTIATDPSDSVNGIKLDMYGYALELVLDEDDGKLGVVTDTGGRAYTAVVRSNANVYDEWGNTDQHDTVLASFNTWCDNMLDIKNFSADFRLFVNGGLKSENFSATVGRIDRSSVTTKQEGVYQIVIEKGILQTALGDYDALIKQIAIDYFSDPSRTADAATVFEESGLYQTIINAMETCKNPTNASGVADSIGADWTDDLGGDGNWYDETSRTFVIRRYTNEGNLVKDIVAEDKIDYQLAPTGGIGGSYENANSGSRYLAEWKLNIFFNPDRTAFVDEWMISEGGTGGTYYNTLNTGSFDASNDSFTVLINNMPINGANFYIPASSTQNFFN